MSDCTVKVDRSGNPRWPQFFPCGRPAVEDGLCKLHLRVRDKRRAKADAYDEKRKQGEVYRQEASDLSKRLGLDVRPHFSWQTSEYTGDFVVPRDWLKEQA